MLVEPAYRARANLLVVPQLQLQVLGFEVHLLFSVLIDALLGRAHVILEHVVLGLGDHPREAVLTFKYDDLEVVALQPRCPLLRPVFVSGPRRIVQVPVVVRLEELDAGLVVEPLEALSSDSPLALLARLGPLVQTAGAVESLVELRERPVGLDFKQQLAVARNLRVSVQHRDQPRRAAPSTAEDDKVLHACRLSRLGSRQQLASSAVAVGVSAAAAASASTLLLGLERHQAASLLLGLERPQAAGRSERGGQHWSAKDTVDALSGDGFMTGSASHRSLTFFLRWANLLGEHG